MFSKRPTYHSLSVLYSEINFTVPKKEKPTLASQFMDRVKYVLDNEGILYEEKVLAQVILKHFPDFRRV